MGNKVKLLVDLQLIEMKVFYEFQQKYNKIKLPEQNIVFQETYISYIRFSTLFNISTI